MKIHRLVQLLGLTKESGRLASDMYDLNDKEYYSKVENKYIPISHMDFQHLIRAFIKQNDTIKEKNDIIDKLSEEEHRWRKAYANDCYTQGWRYVFSEIPNDTDGQEFVDTMKKYLNKESYKMRVKGQHLKKELYGQGRAYHGANLGDSTHMRVYIDKKMGDE